MGFIASERIYEPINDEGAGVLVYAEGAEVSDENAEKYADKVAEVSDRELEAELSVEPAPTPGEFDGMTKDQLIAYYNERIPDNPLPRSIRKPEALRAVRALTHG